MPSVKKWISALCAAVLLCLVFLPQGRAAEPAAYKVTEVDIRIAPTYFKALVSSGQKRSYKAEVSVDAGSSEAADINIRGNSSRQFGLATPTKRIPFELKFSEVRPFGGLGNKSVKFINSFYPYRLLSEFLALDLFAYAGIPTPAHSFAFIRFNDVDFGLYIAVEDVNKAFLSKWYEGPIRAAYKATINEEKEPEYIDSVWFGHVFEKVSGPSDNLTALTRALDRGEGYEQYINVDEWLRFFACIAITGGDGSFLTEQNNAVLYDNNGKFELIPWDLSEAFSGKRMPDSIDRFYLWKNENNPNPLFELLMRNEAYKERYHALIRELADGFLAPEKIRARYDAVLDAIAPYLPRDHSILLNGADTAELLRSDAPDTFFNLRYMLDAYYMNLNAQLEGRADSFPENEQFAEYYENGDSYEYIVSVCEPMSPLLDPTLPETIIGTEKQSGRLNLLLVAVFLLFCAAVFFIIKKKDEIAEAVRREGLLKAAGRRLASHKVMFAFLLFILMYQAIFAWQFGKWEVGEYPYIFHALDYGVGFCSRLLPGAVSNFLLGEVTVLKVTVFETVLLLLFFVCLSRLLEKLYYRFDAADRPYALLLSFLFITGPCSFGIYVKELGMLDAWWLYTAVVVFFLLSKKKLRPLIVVFAFVLILIYYSAVLCFAPFIVILLLYEATLQTDPRDRRMLYLVAGAFAFVAIGSAVYFISFGARNVRLPAEDFYPLLISRGCNGNLQEVYGVLYNVPPEESGIAYGTNTEMLKQVGVKSELMAQIVIRLRQHYTIFTESTKTRYVQVGYAFLLICPALGFQLRFFRRRIKNEKQRMRKFVFFCMLMLFFFINVSCLFVSTDNIKWLAHGFTLTFACFLFVLYREPRMLTEQVKPMLRKIPFPVWACYCLIYAVCVFHPYS